MLEFSSVLTRGEGEGEDLELVGDILGKMLWPGEKMEEEVTFSDLAEGGWKAEGKDLMMLDSPVMENMGLKAVVERVGSLDSRAGWRKGEGAMLKGGKPSGLTRPKVAGRKGEGGRSLMSPACQDNRYCTPHTSPTHSPSTRRV